MEMFYQQFYSYLFTFQFFVGWWIVIDAAAGYPSNDQFHKACHVCGVVGTIALFMYVLFKLCFKDTLIS